MERTGTVKVTDLGGRGNKIFHYGETVKESHFPNGNFDLLIQGGYISVDEPELALESTETDAEPEPEPKSKRRK